MDIEKPYQPSFLDGNQMGPEIVANAIEARDTMDKNGRDPMLLLSLSQLSVNS